MSEKTADFARHPGRQAEAADDVRLSNERRQDLYWTAGDIRNAREHSLFVRRRRPASEMDTAGNWTEHDAPRITVRLHDWTPSHRLAVTSSQSDVNAPREVS